jgi:hypothetical protein
MSITVQHGDNAYWGLHVFLDGSGTAEDEPLTATGVTIRRAGPKEIETALRIDRLIQEAQAAPGFEQTHIRLARRLPDI